MELGGSVQLLRSACVLGHREGKRHVPAHQAYLRKLKSIPDSLKTQIPFQDWVGTVVNEITSCAGVKGAANSVQLMPCGSIF